MTVAASPLIFTDLDGTLLDHHDYSVAAAQPVLHKLAEAGIPVIPNTSKTRAEVMQIREQLALTSPFIVENGAAVYLPVEHWPHAPAGCTEHHGLYCKAFSRPRSFWLGQLSQLDSSFDGLFRHFATMTVAQVCDATGLSVQQAQLAQQREFGEPIEWLGNDSQKRDFIQALHALGTQPVEGGRFIHLKGQTNKGDAMQWLLGEYQRNWPAQQWYSIALGDGQNDAQMLEQADYAVRIASPVNPLPEISTQKPVLTSSAYGPAGWAECVEKLIFTA